MGGYRSGSVGAALAAAALLACGLGCTNPDRPFGSGNGGTGGAPSSGSGGGGTTAAGGADVRCTVASDCTHLPEDDECRARTCDADLCGQTFVMADAVTELQVIGDCKQRRCDGNGGITAVADDGDLPIDNNDCTQDICTAGEASSPNEPLDTPCGMPGAGLTCDGNGACTGCTQPSDCGGLLDCQDRTCDALGVCGLANKQDGLDCDDGIYCNGMDTCQQGSCQRVTLNPCPGDNDSDCADCCDETSTSCTALCGSGMACTVMYHPSCCVGSCDGSPQCLTSMDICPGGEYCDTDGCAPGPGISACGLL